MEIFSKGMKDKWPRLAYIDLFAGPGKSLVDGTNQEIEGSPLLAMNPLLPFTHLYLNEGDSILAEALEKRVSRFGRSDATVHNLDCNEAALDAGSSLFDGPRTSRTLGLAFIDPTAYQITFDAIAKMTQGRRIDLIVTLMTGHLRRFIDHPSFAPHLDPFFGSTNWRKLVERKKIGETISYRKLLDHYEDQLRSIGYADVDDDIRVLNSRNSTIYHLVFASKHPKGLEFFKNISRKRSSGQTRLPI